MATANFSTRGTIHENHSCEIAAVRVKRTTGKVSPGILAFFATFPDSRLRAKFTVP